MLAETFRLVEQGDGFPPIIEGLTLAHMAHQCRVSPAALTRRVLSFHPEMRDSRCPGEGHYSYESGRLHFIPEGEHYQIDTCQLETATWQARELFHKAQRRNGRCISVRPS